MPTLNWCAYCKHYNKEWNNGYCNSCKQYNFYTEPTNYESQFYTAGVDSNDRKQENLFKPNF